MVFERLEKRLILSGTLEALTPLHIGSGRPEIDIGEVEMPILKTPKGEPYIPGSSLKGRTRAEAERIVRSKGLKVCNPPNIANMCGTLESNHDDFCICCKIFGTAARARGISVASKVKFRDAYPIERVDELLERKGIAIDRDKGTVARGALFTIEAVPAGTSFGIEIVAENMIEEELKLLKAALKSVEDSALGGSSSRGFGKVKMQFTKLQERTAGYYLNDEEERVLEGEALKEWMER